MKLDGNLAFRLDGGDKIISVIRLQQAGHVFNTNGIGAHLLKLLRIVGKVFVGEHRPGGIGKRGLYVRRFPFSSH